MPLLFADLDNTVSDRAASLDAWLDEYLADRYGGVDQSLKAALIEADGDGVRPKKATAADFARLLNLTDAEQGQIIAVLRAGTLRHLRATPGHNEALDRARAAGWIPLIVTNGNVAQQEAKVEILDLAAHVDGMVVSEGVGVAKPDPEIFRIAAASVGGDLADAWMIGDQAGSDIAGADAAGIRSIWLRRGRDYPADQPTPTAIADSFAEAIDLVISS